MSMLQKRLIVKGRVQDVDYREIVKNVARSMNILGEVRNLKDGTVEILCGYRDKDQLKNFKDMIDIKNSDESKPNVDDINDYPLEKLNLGFFTIDYGNLQEELLKKMNIGVKVSKSMNTEMRSMNKEMNSMNTNISTRFDNMEEKYGTIGDGLKEIVNVIKDIFKDYEITPKKKKKN